MNAPGFAQRTRDRRFDPWRRFDSERGSELLREATRLMQDFEEHTPESRFRRQRGRRKSEQRAFLATVEALAADATQRYLTSRDGLDCLAVSMNEKVKRDRYAAPAEHRRFPHMVHMLSHPGLRLLELVEPGEYRGKRTTIRAGAYLIELVRKHGISVADLAQDFGQEIVILKGRKERLTPEVTSERSLWLDYKDTPETREIRAQVRAINEWNREADIACTLPGVDPGERFLRRYFNNARFDEGGRLFDGFWQGMTKEQRRAHITLDGRPVVGLDFRCMVVRLAYAAAGAALPEGDAYAVPGYEDCRDGIKRMLSAMLFCERRLTGWPGYANDSLRNEFPKGTKLKDVIAAIQARHPALADQWFTGIGHRLMFTESEILVAALLELREREIVALPVHDCLIVADSTAEEAGQVMLDAFEGLTGFAASISRE